MTDLVFQSTLREPQQAHATLSGQLWPWAKSMLMAGHRLDVEVRLHEDAKTDQQRKYYHGVILTVIAESARPNGEKYPMPIWKEYFRDKFLGFNTQTCVNPLTGKKSRRRVRKSTEDLGIKAYNLLIEQVTAFACTELGVQFPARIDPETGEILP